MTLTRDLSKLGAWRRRSKGLSPVSKKQRRINAEFARARDIVRERAAFTCEMRLDGCTFFATDVHHIAGRVGPNANDPSNLMAACRSCHRKVTDHEVPVYELGLSRRRNGRVA